jgi:hypothetical protein
LTGGLLLKRPTNPRIWGASQSNEFLNYDLRLRKFSDWIRTEELHRLRVAVYGEDGRSVSRDKLSEPQAGSF